MIALSEKSWKIAGLAIAGILILIFGVHTYFYYTIQPSTDHQKYIEEANQAKEEAEKLQEQKDSALEEASKWREIAVGLRNQRDAEKKQFKEIENEIKLLDKEIERVRVRGANVGNLSDRAERLGSKLGELYPDNN